MKRSFLAVCFFFAALAVTSAASLTEAKVTRLINDVSKVPPGQAAQSAALGDTIQPLWQVSTGDQSRSELTFNDLTLVRLGANTVFDFKPNEREVDLRNGTILLQVPKNSGGATIQTAPITAAVTGTTVLCEFRSGARGLSKWIVIEGELRITLKAVSGESVVLKAGQILTILNEARRLPAPSDVDLKRLLKTSRLINDGPFSPEEEELIAAAVNAQEEFKSKGVLIEVNYGIKNDLLNPNRQAANTATAIQNRRDAQPPTKPPVPPARPPMSPPVPTPVPTPVPAPPPPPPIVRPTPIPEPTYNPP